MSQEKKEVYPIYGMKLHDTIVIDRPDSDLQITRVPGGWLYQIVGLTVEPSSPVFVPYNTEFLIF